MLHVVADIEAELRSGLEKDADDIAYARTEPGIALEEQALLIENPFLYLQFVLTIQAGNVYGYTRHGQGDIESRTHEETHSVGLLQGFGIEFHLSQLEAALGTEANLGLRPGNANEQGRNDQ
jgi:hypothetical protein